MRNYFLTESQKCVCVCVHVPEGFPCVAVNFVANLPALHFVSTIAFLFSLTDLPWLLHACALTHSRAEK